MQEKTVVLVVDDEVKIRELVKAYLEANGFTGLSAGSGKEGMTLFEKYRNSATPVSLILLDLMLPDFSGEEFCRKVRHVSDTPIIMITAKVDEESIIHGLSIGADDYVCKPFSPRQLIARVQAALRRRSLQKTGAKSAQLQLIHDGLCVDTEKRNVTLNGGQLSLTRDEYNILVLLMGRMAKIFTRDEIIERIKGDDYDGFDRSIDTHIKNLRAKLGDDPRAPRYIITVYGMGYRFGRDSVL
ncbi:MAG: response regulator transcription factor [Treponema sp.]|jgi:DNA-binding response OmpR family regulator|nr:response regulator transcription factor [Treponema sp.]